MREQHRLPDEGVMRQIDEHFYLFHHCSLHSSVNTEELKRLLEYDIRIKKGPFTTSEDARIYKNWARACDMFETLDYDSPFFYLGKGAVTEHKGREHLEKTRNIPFWPAMCHGLINRSAKQVYSRMEYLFDPEGWNTIKGKYDLKHFTAEDDQRLLELYKTHEGNWRLIAAEMKRPQKVLCRRCQSLLQREQTKNDALPQDKWKGLWVRILNNEKWEATSTQFFEDVFINRTIKPQDWDEIVRRTRHAEKVLRKTWKKMCKMVSAEVEQGMLLDDAFDKIIETSAPRLTVVQLAQFMRIVQKMLPNDTPVLPRRNTGIDFSELAQKCLDADVTGFKCHVFSDELSFLWRKLTIAFMRFQHYIGGRLKMHLMAHDVLRIMANACERAKSRNLIRNVLVEETIRFIIKKKNPNWIPPYKFKKYVEDDRLLPLFQEKNNSELYGKKYHAALIRMFNESDVSDVEEDWQYGRSKS
ncbi:unnamed protein product, partial [Mesorhabditis belari]|uniref:Myb-like domain-containing protein n=1 Tax=Mesorhabditis belari TaxID=2138241 RepID=A0AAF3EIN1_9BILA